MIFKYFKYLYGTNNKLTIPVQIQIANGLYLGHDFDFAISENLAPVSGSGLLNHQSLCHLDLCLWMLL